MAAKDSCHYARDRRSTRDKSVRQGLEKTRRIDLGLALLEALILPGQSLNCQDIASWCGCTDSGIYVLERKALRKLRRRMAFLRPSR